ncbi:MAG: sulfite exporter TauE/SafE family protein [Balneolaceae bacterium]
MELWTALALGFIGSFHCVGMCGPIAMAIPRNSSSIFSLTSYAVIYNTGRILTYVLFGLIFGLLGTQITISGFQGTLSILLGAGIVIGVLFKSFFKKREQLSFVENLSLMITNSYSKLMRKETSSALFGMGFLNGLLPCAFVYSGLAAAVLTQTPVHSMAYMALFGLGTFPAMYLMYLAPSVLSLDMRQMMRDFIPYLAFTLGIFLIVRGMVLNDLIVSPEITERISSYCVFPGTSMN